MNCPICNSPLTHKGNKPNGGTLYVAEDFETSQEIYDGDIHIYRCEKNHVIYFEPPGLDKQVNTP
jgi:hypothetical protein